MADNQIPKYVDTKDGLRAIKDWVKKTFSPIGHKHTKSEITDFPDSLKNPESLTVKNSSGSTVYDGSEPKTIDVKPIKITFDDGNATKTEGSNQFTYDGVSEKELTITKASVNLGKADNTADKDKNVLSATKLTTGRDVRTDLESSNAVNFDGTKDVTPGVKGILPVAHGGTGKDNLNDAANGLINALPDSTATPEDGDMIVTQYAGGGADNKTYYRRSLSTVWDYMKGKVSAVLGLTKENYSGKAATAGNADTATALQTGRTIGLSGAATGTATEFNGTKNITIPVTKLDATKLEGTASVDTTGNAATATALETGRTIGLSGAATGTATSFDGTKNITIPVTSVDAAKLTGTASVNTTGNAGTATALQNPRSVQTDLGSEKASTFDGSADITPGVKGTLPISHGGTGATDAATARKNLGVGTAGTVDLDNVEDHYLNGTGKWSEVIAKSAEKLTTARSIQTNLESEKAASFDGSANVEPGIKGTLPISHGGTGKTTGEDAANVLLNSLSTGASTPVDDDYYISQWANGNATSVNNTTYHRRPMSALWEYIKGKISSVLGLTKDNYSGKAATAGAADTAKKLATARTIALSGAATGTATAFDGSANVSIPVTKLDATALDGIIPLKNIPKAAQERMVTVPNNAAKLKLTTDDIQKGDTVKVADTGLMYYVVDDTKLNSEDGYTVYVAGSAASATIADSIKDAGDGRTLKMNYSADGLASTDWVAAWNGNTLRAISPANITAGKATADADGNKISDTYLKRSGGTMTGDIAFQSTGTTGTSKKITFYGSTDGAQIYYTVPSSDQGNLVFNMIDDANAYIQFAMNGAVKSYISPSDGVYHGKATSADELATERTIALTGDATGSAKFDGSKDIQIKTLINNYTGATANAEGKAGLVPAPSKGITNYFLKSDGSWGSINDVVVNTKVNDAVHADNAGLLSTARKFTIGTVTKTFNGSADVSWTIDELGLEKRVAWNAVTHGQVWSRICYIDPANNVEGSSGILAITCTRGNVVCNYVFVINASHSSNCSIIQLNGTSYSTIRIRGVVDVSGNCYIELYDTANSIASGTAQTWHCIFIPLATCEVTAYTAFTSGATLPSGYSVKSDFTTTAGRAVVADSFVGALKGTADNTVMWNNQLSLNWSGSITDADWYLATNGNNVVRGIAPANMKVGTANNLNYQHTNEINFKGGDQERTWFNYRGDNDGTSGNTAAKGYYFGNNNGGTSGVTLYADAFSGKAATAGVADYLAGFSSRTANFTWGNQIGTAITSMNDSTGGSIGFRRDNPSAGKMSMVIDGTVYANEGQTDLRYPGWDAVQNKPDLNTNYYRSDRGNGVGATTDWNGLTQTGSYKVQMSSWGAAATYHAPNNLKADLYSFGILMVFKSSSGDSEHRLVQLYMPHNTGANTWCFRWHNGTDFTTGWSGWQWLSTDTNTWRPVENVLTSTSTTNALSAAQGKALNDKFGSYLPLTGGKLTGSLTFANGIKNVVGDDSAIGDCNIGGTLGLQGVNGTTGLAFFKNGTTWGGTGDYGLISYDGNFNINKVLTTNQSISYRGTKATFPMIKFKDNPSDANGEGIIIGGGGLTVVGGGESADAAAASVSNGGTEQLILANDGAIDFYTNTQNGIASATHTQITNDGTFTGKIAWDHTNHPSTFPPSAHNHDASNITSGVLGIARGGTGASNAATARGNLGAFEYVSGFSGDLNTLGTTHHDCIAHCVVGCKNAPTSILGGNQFLVVQFWNGDKDYTSQYAYSFNGDTIATRHISSGTWSGWSNVNTNTWRGITDSYSGTDTGTSLSQKGANSLYNALLNGYANSAGSATNATRVKGYTFGGSSGKVEWVKLGTLTSNGDSSNTIIEVFSGGAGYNGNASQNSWMRIFIKDAWQSTGSATGAFGVTVEYGSQNYYSEFKVKVLASAANKCDVWVKCPWGYWNGNYTVTGNFSDWTNSGTHQEAEPTGTEQSVAYTKLASTADIPASLPANGGNAATVNGHTVNINVPADAKFTDHTYNFAGTTFISGDQSNGTHDANAMMNGHYYYSSNGPATSLGATTNDGAIYSQAYSDAWRSQIAQDYRNGNLFVRGKNNGTWQGWRRIPFATGATVGGADQLVYMNNGQITAGTSASTSATANTIVKRDGSGYVYAKYYNQSSGAETPTTSSYFIYANSDGWFRKSTIANAKKVLMDSQGATITWGDLKNKKFLTA